ncbi:hypothetical protein XM38_052330 [Halomicronema hongdechloris C2206]|uniref:Uncharacterized protein n=1 Tax=Halomicronema hongdechloris C2206 TaxID=1641165 RepID=A0A1Z3HVC1_9CYAN|nr:hypothetical protein [Halomicronema hongdechloris]ASC74258.1 hypothetical protein XM38_052330 [Halomicronema hongdechloris C2206]
MDFKTLYALFLGPVILLVLLITARIIHGAWNRAFAMSVLVGLSGITLGWSLALLGSPQTEAEVALFQETWNVLIGLITGYLGAKVIDPLLQALFQEADVLKDSTMGANVLIFLITFLTSTIGGYAFRNL